MHLGHNIYFFHDLVILTLILTLTTRFNQKEVYGIDFQAASGRRQVSLSNILSFTTGAIEVPLLGFVLESSITFTSRNEKVS